MSIQTKALIFLIVLGIVDIVIPIPILGLILIYVIMQKPPWFADVVAQIYKTG